ncbi:MAG: DnaD domain protein [Firmicutes bacterium]|nr:DnaD domain protein [Bacillota bacterium]
MSFVSLHKEFNDSKKIVLDAVFVLDYMPLAPEEYTKVYLMAFTYANAGGCSLESICAKLDMEKSEVLEAFKFWERKGLVDINFEPLNIIFNKVVPISKQVLKYDKAKFADFNKELCRLINKREISQTEYNEYYSLIEGYGLEENALLAIIGYSKRLKKDESINHRYITRVAYDFIEKGYRTFKTVNEHIEKTALYETDLIDIYKALKISSVPNHLDKQLLIKWKTEFKFDLEMILAVAKLFSKNAKSKVTIDKFDTELALYNKHRLATIEKIEEFVVNRTKNIELVKEFITILGIYEPYEWAVEVYFEPWLKLGFSADGLLAIANNCKEFPYHKRSLKSIADNFIMPFANENCFSIESINEFFVKEKIAEIQPSKNQKNIKIKDDDTVVAREGNKNFISRTLTAEQLNEMFERIDDNDL